jgi:hypothetical protein
MSHVRRQAAAYGMQFALIVAPTMACAAPDAIDHPVNLIESR